MQKITMYTSDHCPYCTRAETLLQQKGVFEINKIRIDENPAERDAMMARTQRRTVPQIYIGDTHVGGFDDLAALDRAGQLISLLTTESTK